MSHVVQIETEVRDPAAIAAACQRLGLPGPTRGTTKLYSEQVSGLLVKLPGWEYPIACDTANGIVRYDNFEGRWGDHAKLNQFLQAYAIEKARSAARLNGHTVYETPLSDGSIKLTVQIGGVA